MKKQWVLSLFFSWLIAPSKAQTEGPISDINIETRIIGGTQTDPGEYPYFVGLEGCGASLIHEDIVLSAAHCNNIANNTVIVSAWRRGQERDGGEVRQIVAREKHPYYDPTTNENDFLILKLDRPSTKTPIPINLDSTIPIDGQELTVMGFGARVEGWSSTNFLRDVNVFAMPHDNCNANYNGLIVEDLMLCAGVEGGGKDSCTGDSGGPIVDLNGLQVGVVSWGWGCGRDGQWGVYARTDSASAWIRSQICSLSESKPEYCNSRPTPGTTMEPTTNPTSRPTANPTRSPTRSPTSRPTSRPTRSPTSRPTRSPTRSPTSSPTSSPTRDPTATSSTNPTLRPTSRQITGSAAPSVSMNNSDGNNFTASPSSPSTNDGSSSAAASTLLLSPQIVVLLLSLVW